MANIYLIRHAHTTLNGKMLFQGGQTNSELDSIGLDQIKNSSESINKLLPDNYLLVCSPLIRTKQTAMDLNLHTDNIIYDDRIREIDFGKWEGKSLDSVRKEYPIEVKKYYEDDPNIKMPNGESIGILADRMIEAIMDYSDRNYDNVVFVTHGNAISIGLSALILNDQSFKRILDVPKNVSLTKVIVSNNRVNLEYYNRICY